MPVSKSIKEDCPNCGGPTLRAQGEPSKILTCPHCAARFCGTCARPSGKADDDGHFRCPKCGKLVPL